MTPLVAPAGALLEPTPAPLTLAQALSRIAARATSLDRDPRFPTENFADLRAAGALATAIDNAPFSLTKDVALVRAVAGADASTARILDGHLNGVERLALCAPPELLSAEHAALAGGELLLGVWGADPAEGEGRPATIVRAADGTLLLRGVKTFCSGAGGVQRALVVARDGKGARRVAYIDPSEGVEIDRGWYRASGLRSSESHRVQFIDTPILALLGGDGELTREPYFARDAVRTAATWAGLADCILRATRAALKDRQPDELQLYALGRMRVAHGSIDRWLEHTVARLTRAVEDPSPQDAADPAAGASQTGALAAECRVAIVACAREIALQATHACGSRALANGGTLERARRDLDLFVLQHRLDPKLVSLGRLVLERGCP